MEWALPAIIFWSIPRRGTDDCDDRSHRTNESSCIKHDESYMLPSSIPTRQWEITSFFAVKYSKIIYERDFPLPGVIAGG